MNKRIVETQDVASLQLSYSCRTHPPENFSLFGLEMGMNVLFLQKDFFAKGGIMALSAMLKREGYQCETLVDELETDTITKSIECDPDVIAFSITTGEFLWMRQIGTRIRKHLDGKVIVCGGSHPTFYPELISEPYLDAICIGEGDIALPDFLSTLKEGRDITRVQNFWVKKDGRIFKNDLRPLVDNLDSLPFWDRDIYKKYEFYGHAPDMITHQYSVMTGRGCPYQCSFCFNKAYNQLYHNKGKIVRRRSIRNVIEELLILKTESNPKFIIFLDDSFTFPPLEWVFDFLECYSTRIQIPFWIITRADLLNEFLMAKLKEANCYSFKIGVETGNDDFRKNVIQKKVVNSEILEAAHLAKKYGIKVHTFNMAGCPDETLDMVFETFEFNKKIKPDFLWCSLLHPYPGTDIFDKAVECGAIDSSADFHSFDHTYFRTIPTSMPYKSEIVRLQKLMFFGVLFHIPRRIMAVLIKLPLNRLYNLIFGFTYFIGLYRVNKVGVLTLLRLSVGRLAKYTK